MRSVFNASIVSLGMALYFGTFKATNNSTNTLTETYELFMDKRDRAIVPIVITFQYHYSSHLHMSVLQSQVGYKSATTIPATPRTPGSAVAMAPEPATLLATEPAAEVALPAALVTDEPPLLDDELPVLVPEELELSVPEELELPVLEALEPEEVAELPPVMLLRIEPV